MLFIITLSQYSTQYSLNIIILLFIRVSVSTARFSVHFFTLEYTIRSRRFSRTRVALLDFTIDIRLFLAINQFLESRSHCKEKRYAFCNR